MSICSNTKIIHKLTTHWILANQMCCKEASMRSTKGEDSISIHITFGYNFNHCTLDTKYYGNVSDIHRGEKTTMKYDMNKKRVIFS